MWFLFQLDFKGINKKRRCGFTLFSVSGPLVLSPLAPASPAKCSHVETLFQERRRRLRSLGSGLTPPAVKRWRPFILPLAPPRR